MRRSIFIGIMVLGILTIKISSGFAKPQYGDDCSMCHISPVVQVFNIPQTYDSLTVPITDFTATDKDSARSSQAGVIGYLVTESSAMPGASASGWSRTPPDSYTFTTPGSYTLYAWAKDPIGNISTNIASASVYIEFGNNPPVADAGSVQMPAVGEMVLLDGGGSSDPDGDPLTFQWSLVTTPVNSEAAISNPTSVNPTFFVDVPGEYIVELVVNDGTVDSPSDIMTINTEGSPPVAVINLDQPAFTGNTIHLDGSGSSDPDGDPLTFQWSLGSVPVGSIAALSDPALVAPTFVADVAGEYLVHLIVNDGMQDSAVESVSLSVTLADEPSAAENQIPDEGITQGDEFVVQNEGESSSLENDDDVFIAENDDNDGVIHEDDGVSLENDNESNKSWSRRNRFWRQHGRYYYRNRDRWGRR